MRHGMTFTYDATHPRDSKQGRCTALSTPHQLACNSTACAAGCAIATAGGAAPAAAAGARGENVRSAKPRSMQNWNSLSGPLSCPARRSLYSCMGCGGFSSQKNDTTILAGGRTLQGEGQMLESWRLDQAVGCRWASMGDQQPSFVPA